jgi:DNA-binding Lrp family transcriptional regulator
LKNIFAEISSTVNAGFSSKKNLQSNRRHAFIFLTTEPDSSENAFEDLKKVDGVVELYPLRGAYDIIAKVSGESLEHLRGDVLKEIKNLGSIKSTLTLMEV